MERTDLIFLILIVVISLWQIGTLLRARKGIAVKAESPGRLGGVILCLIILGIAVWKRGNFSSSWPVYLGILVMMALYMLAPIGLNAKGLFSTSRFIAYDDLAYYAIEQPEAPKCRVRLARSAGRETVMMVSQEQIGQVEAWLKAAGVDDFESYGAQVRSRRM